jgi:hypothetical protein
VPLKAVPASGERFKVIIPAFFSNAAVPQVAGTRQGATMR